MLKRIIAALLACLLLAGALPALAEAGDIVIEDAAALIPDAGLPSADIGGLSGELSTEDPAPYSPPVAANAAQAVALSISKSCTQEATLGVDYQITVPGKLKEQVRTRFDVPLIYSHPFVQKFPCDRCPAIFYDIRHYKITQRQCSSCDQDAGAPDPVSYARASRLLSQFFAELLQFFDHRIMIDHEGSSMQAYPVAETKWRIPCFSKTVEFPEECVDSACFGKIFLSLI